MLDIILFCKQTPLTWLRPTDVLNGIFGLEFNKKKMNFFFKFYESLNFFIKERMDHEKKGEKTFRLKQYLNSRKKKNVS